jgi:hypothetical protein
MDVLLKPDALTVRLTGRILDLSLFLGPMTADVVLPPGGVGLWLDMNEPSKLCDGACAAAPAARRGRRAQRGRRRTAGGGEGGGGEG